MHLPMESGQLRVRPVIVLPLSWDRRWNYYRKCLAGAKLPLLFRFRNRLVRAALVTDQLLDPVGQAATVRIRFRARPVKQILAKGNAGLCFSWGPLSLFCAFLHMFGGVEIRMKSRVLPNATIGETQAKKSHLPISGY